MKITQEEMAGLLGISRSYLANLEAGRKNVGENTIKKMSESSGFSTYYLTTGRKTSGDITSANTDRKSVKDMSEDELNQKLKQLLKQMKKDNEPYHQSIREKLISLSKIDFSVMEALFLDAMSTFLMDIERFKTVDDDEDLLFMASFLKTIYQNKDIALKEDVNIEDVHKDIEKTIVDMKYFLERYYGIQDIEE